MSEDRFEYFLNAVCYFIWRGGRVVDSFIYKIIQGIVYLIAEYLLWGSWREKVHERIEYVRKDMEERRKTPQYSLCVRTCVEIFCVCYCMPMVFLFMGLWLRAFKGEYPVVVMLIMCAVVFWSWNYAYRLLDDDDRFLRYFKKFKKKDAEWHRKWRLIAWIYCLGGVVSFFGSIVTMMAIATGGYGNIDFPFLNR